MIVLDRSLAPAEAAALPTDGVFDLHGAPPTGRRRARDAVLAWLDDAYRHTFDGRPMDDFFGLDGVSYWLNVRFRLFFDLYADAGLLDRLPEPDFVDRIRTVYCDAHTADFWSRWAPAAERVLPADEEPSTAPPTPWTAFARRYLRPLPARWAALRRAERASWTALFFSSTAYNIRRPDGLWDRQFGPLFDRYPAERWLRVEYEPLPRKDLALRESGPRTGPRLHPTLSTDAILAGHLAAHPLAVVRLVRDIRRLRRRFAGPLERSYTFPFLDERWGVRLGRTVRGLAPSVALFHLLRQAFARTLARQRPAYVVATSENNSIGRLFVDAARTQGIETYGVQHGLIQPDSPDYRLSEAEAARGLPDHFFCWGESTRAYLVEQSHYPPDRVHAVGRLLSDTLADVAPDPAVEAFGAEREKPVLFFASQPQPYPKNRAVAADLLAAFCRLHGFCCVVKLHPRESDDELYRRAFSAHADPADLLLHDGAVPAIVGAARYAATCYSTVAWEIMSLERPLLIFDPLHLDLLRLRGRGAVYHADLDPASFVRWKEAETEHVQANARLARALIGPIDGGVAERMRRILP